MFKILIESQYIGNCCYWSLLLRSDTIYLDKQEHFVKRSYRNRAHILGANGLLRLSIPLVSGKHQHSSMKDVRISYNENWQKIHWQSFTSAYRRSPFFEFYEDTFRIFYEEKHEFLFDYNLLTMKTISSILKIELPVYFTDNYQLKTNDDFSDRRSFFLPGKVYESDFPAYPQVFNDRFEFIGDLCVLDVIFNLGKKSTEYLMGIKF